MFYVLIWLPFLRPCFRDEESVASPPGSQTNLGMCQTGGGNTTQTTWYESKWSQAGFAHFSLFPRNLNRKKRFQGRNLELNMWFSWTVRARIPEVAAEKPSMTVKIPSTCKMGVNDVIYRQNTVKICQNGVFFARHFAVTFSGFQGVLQHGPNSCWVV